MRSAVRVYADVTEVVAEPGLHIGADVGGQRFATGRYYVVHWRPSRSLGVFREPLPVSKRARRAGITYRSLQIVNGVRGEGVEPASKYRANDALVDLLVEPIGFRT